MPPAPVACYRHPNIPAGVSCHQCGRPICSQCIEPSALGFRCPTCMGYEAMYARPEARPMQAVPEMVFPFVTCGLVVVSVVVFIIGWVTAEVVVAGITFGGFQADLAMIPALVPEEPWRLLTSAFVYVAIIDLLVGAGVFAWMGWFIESELGYARFVALWVATQSASCFAVAVLDAVTETRLLSGFGGAFGVVFGLLGAGFWVANAYRANWMKPIFFATLVLFGLCAFALLFSAEIPAGFVAGLAAGYVLVEVPERFKQNGELVVASIVGGAGMALLIATYAITALERLP